MHFEGLGQLLSISESASCDYVAAQVCFSWSLCEAPYAAPHSEHMEKVANAGASVAPRACHFASRNPWDLFCLFALVWSASQLAMLCGGTKPSVIVQSSMHRQFCKRVL